MGYDVTFHPVSVDDLRHYVFDVIEQPGLSAARASEIAPDPEKRRGIDAAYEQLAEWAQQLGEGQSLAMNETIAYATAQIAGFLHPYWYARNAAISMLDDEAVLELFVPLAKLPGAPTCLSTAATSAHIGLNYSASGVITDLDKLERNLRRLGLDGDPPKLFTVFDGSTLASLRETIAYCRKHDLALIEAADIVVPITGDAGTDPEHYREAEHFDESSNGDRQWFEPPSHNRRPAFEALQASTEPLANDAVAVKRLIGRNRTGLLVPLYLVPDLDRQKFLYTKYAAVLYDDGKTAPVLKRRLKVVRRSFSHRGYWRRLFEYERSFYEDEARADPSPDIEAAQIGIGDTPERIFESGLMAAAVGEWSLANAIFRKALRAADFIIRGEHAERDAYNYPGNLANVLRTQWFARALLEQSPDRDTLIQACDAYCEFAKSLKRADWTEYKQRDYVDFVLTSLVAGRRDRATEMLEFRRPFDAQTELISLCRSIATAERGSAVARASHEKGMQLLEVMRHPNGGKFLLYGRLAALQLALAMDQCLTEEPNWGTTRDVAEWLGH